MEPDTQRYRESSALRAAAFAALTAVAVLGCSEKSGEASGGSCLEVDRVVVEPLPPAGVRVGFRVLGCDQKPVTPLKKSHVTVVNDVRSEPFGAGGEGGGVSAPREPSDIGLYTVLALDFSDSIFTTEKLDHVTDAALEFIDQFVSRRPQNLKHKVAIYAFGATSKSEWVIDFSDSSADLVEAVERLRTGGSRGGTNLYGAYTTALNHMMQVGSPDERVVEKFLIFMTDGSHEADEGDAMREEALKRKEQSGVVIFTIGIRGNYDEREVRELASRPDYSHLAKSSESLPTLFRDVGWQAHSLVTSNYVIGVCTPVEFGQPSLTFRIDIDGLSASETVPYPSGPLNGDLTKCDPLQVAGVPNECPVNSGYPCLCDLSRCQDGSPCVGVYYLGDINFGLCAKPCETDEECEIDQEAQGTCALQIDEFEPTYCVLRCESHHQCPEGESCGDVAGQSICHP